MQHPRSFEKILHLALAGLLLLAPLGVSAETPGGETARSLTESQAVRIAIDNNPSLRARRAEVDAVAAQLQTAKTYPYNPEIALSQGRRKGGGARSTDRGVELSQQISIGGKRRLEIRSAEARLADAKSRLRREERLLAAAARAAFVEALRARELLAVERANVDLARNLAEVARRRMEAGEATQIEMNLALAQVGRDELSLSMAEGAYTAARAVLAETIGLPSEDLPQAAGKLTIPEATLPSLSTLLAAAADNRADLAAFDDRIRAAEATRKLRRRELVPDLRVSATWDREEGTDRILGAGLALSIPIFNRNRGRIAEADASHRQTLAEKSATEARVQREVTAAHALFAAATAATRNLEQRVLGTLSQNLDLLQRSLQAGKIGWTEVIVFRREFTFAQRDYVETVAQARLAKIRLDLASGTDLSALFDEEFSR
ncbi:MAG TPA: TolC family protein [Acidobacteria bacterium]|nr:TolC family protein [Acidobacteriota bacterium]